MTDQVTRDRQRQRLTDHVAAIVDHAELNGWTVATEPIPIADPDVDRAIGIGAMKIDQHPDDTTDKVEWLFTTVVALRSSTGRIITLLDDDRGGARVVLEASGHNLYWSGGATTWRDALADPQAWASWWPTPEQQRNARIVNRISEAL